MTSSQPHTGSSRTRLRNNKRTCLKARAARFCGRLFYCCGRLSSGVRPACYLLSPRRLRSDGSHRLLNVAGVAEHIEVATRGGQVQRAIPADLYLPYGTLHPGDMIAPALRVIGPLTVVLHHAFRTNRKQPLAIKGIHFAVRAHHNVAVVKSKPREFRVIGLLLAL